MSFVSRILSNLESDGDRASVIEVHGKDLVPTSRKELAGLRRRAAKFIAGAGVKPGDRVALLAPNSAKWAAADLAVLSVGAIVVPLYSRQDPNELAVMLDDCTPSLLLVADDELAGGIQGAWKTPCQIALFSDVFAADETAEQPFEHQDSDPVTIIYTSGTSGKPKGVVLNSANVDYMLPTTASAVHEITGARGTDDTVFHFLPFCFAGSRIMLWTQLYRPNPITASTDLTNLVQEMGTADPHYYLNVPAVLERIKLGVGDKIRTKGGIAEFLYSRGVAAFRAKRTGQSGLMDGLWLSVASRVVFSKIKQQIGPSLEFLICGSAPLSDDTQSWFEMLGITVYQVYGLTETTAIVTMDTPNRIEAGRVGSAINGCDIKVTEDGELVCRGPNIFAGYWGNDAATQDAIRDGWFHSGDKAEIDEHGNWKIIGRVKNLLVPESGHNVAPEPLEQKLMEACDRIEQAVVVGHGKPYLAAIVTGTVDATEVEKAIEAVNAALPHYRRIRKYHRADENFTIENGLLTANQKLKRGAIEEHYKNHIDQLYAS